MAIGKREQIVGVSVGAILVIALVHMLVFKPRAEEFGQELQKYTEGTTALENAEIPPSEGYLKTYSTKTKEYDKRVSDAVGKLNFDVPLHYQNLDPKNIEQRYQDTIALCKELAQLKTTVQKPRLVFLDNLPEQGGLQGGWNFPEKLPEIPTMRSRGAVWDLVNRLKQQNALFSNYASDNPQRVVARYQYNQVLSALSIEPIEVCNFYVLYNGSTPVFYNRPNDIEVPGYQRQDNQYSVARFGQMLPGLKKLWMAHLIYEARDENEKMTEQQLRDYLEVELQPDYSLLSLNRQLRALIDIIKAAQKNQVDQIYKVSLMHPGDLGAATDRATAIAEALKPSPTPGPGGAGQRGGGEGFMVGGATPPPGASPTPGVITLPADKKIGMVAGLQLGFTAQNSAMVGFLFDIGTMPGSHTLDTLTVQTLQAGQPLNVEATIELVTMLEKLTATAPAKK